MATQDSKAVPDKIQEKACTRCHKIKPLGNFSPDRRKSDGCQSWCRACKRAWHHENAERERERMRQYHKKNAERLCAKRRKRYWKNPERARKYQKRWYRENREAVLEYSRKYHQEHKEEISKYARQYRAENLERLQRNRRRWARENPEEVRRFSRERRARKAGADGSHTVQEWLELLDQYGHKCLACGSTEDLSEDHVIPLSRGGSDDIDNIQVLCCSCNSSKGADVTDYR